MKEEEEGGINIEWLNSRHADGVEVSLYVLFQNEKKLLFYKRTKTRNTLVQDIVKELLSVSCCWI